MKVASLPSFADTSGLLLFMLQASWTSTCYKLEGTEWWFFHFHHVAVHAAASPKRGQRWQTLSARWELAGHLTLPLEEAGLIS